MRKALRVQLGQAAESESDSENANEESKDLRLQDIKNQLSIIDDMESKIKDLEDAQAPENTKENAYRIWHSTFKDVPDEYDFVIQSDNDTFKKGSQVFLCYGRMSNRDALKRYGFCLTSNKYNNMYIKLRLQQNDPEFKYR